MNTGLGTLQQSVPGMQHCVSQQNSFAGQTVPLHGGVPHFPLSQNGSLPPHLVPQVPQLSMSFCAFTHDPLQHVSPIPHAGLQAAPPVLDALVLVVVVVVVLVVALLLVGPDDMQHARQAGL
jgi:hypothetical protein